MAEPTDYREIGREEGLKGARLNLYANFMTERFPDARDSYACEWAKRFRKGHEFHDAGEEGRAILLRLLTEERDGWAAHVTAVDIGDAIRRAVHAGTFSLEDLRRIEDRITEVNTV